MHGAVLFETFSINKFHQAMAGETRHKNDWFGAVARAPIHDFVADNFPILHLGIGDRRLGGP